MHSQMNAVFNDFYSAVKQYHLSLAYHHGRSATSWSWGMNYMDYGLITGTDASGNIYGQLRPVDWVMQVSASKKYLSKWNYGVSLKFIRSDYGEYRSSGIAADVGVLYSDSARGITASVAVRHLGFQLRPYDGSSRDDLPFDLQAGITKRLAHAPLSFSLTAQQLHRFDISYNDTSFNNENGLENASMKKFSADKLLRHLVAAMTVYIGDHLEAYAGYNFLRRRDLTIGAEGNGWTGFSIGAALLFEKIQIRYARAYYQPAAAYNQFGLNLPLNRYFGLGKWGERIGW